MPGGIPTSLLSDRALRSALKAHLVLPRHYGRHTVLVAITGQVARNPALTPAPDSTILVRTGVARFVIKDRDAWETR